MAGWSLNPPGQGDARARQRPGYLDDVRSPATSEPTDDLAALTLVSSVFRYLIGRFS
jgi:hypothetical protein